MNLLTRNPFTVGNNFIEFPSFSFSTTTLTHFSGCHDNSIEFCSRWWGGVTLWRSLLNFISQIDDLSGRKVGVLHINLGFPWGLRWWEEIVRALRPSIYSRGDRGLSYLERIWNEKLQENSIDLHGLRNLRFCLMGWIGIHLVRRLGEYTSLDMFWKHRYRLSQTTLFYVDQSTSQKLSF